MESSRLFAIDDQRDLNGYYLLAIMLESHSLDLGQLSHAFYLFKHPYLLESVSPRGWSELQLTLPEHEIRNISAELVSYSPAVLNRTFASAVEYLVSLGLLEAEKIEERLIYSLPELSAPLTVSSTIQAKARIVSQTVRNTAPERLRELLQEALRRHGKSSSVYPTSLP